MATTVAAAPGWRPDPSGLQHVVGMLRESTDGSGNQEKVYARLQAYATQGDFNNYLAYILARGASGIGGDGLATPDSGVNAESVRQAAGLLLKNNLKSLYKNLAPDIRAYINKELLSAIGDDSRLVRSAVAVCITAIVSKAGLQVWPDLFPTLVSCLDSNHDSFLDGALNALSKICEDAPDLLDEDPSQPLDVIIPKLFVFFHHPKDAVRIKVVHILNQFLLVMPPALNDNIDAYLAALFRVAEDASFEVRKRVCSAICMLLETKPDALLPHMPNIVAYMVNASKDPSPLVAMEACEFWSAYATAPSAAPTLRAALPKLVPILLDSMVYSEEDRAVFAMEQEDDDMIPDRPEDARPRFHTSRFMSSVSGGVSAEGPRAPVSSPLSTSPNLPPPVAPASGSTPVTTASGSPNAPLAQVDIGKHLSLGPGLGAEEVLLVGDSGYPDEDEDDNEDDVDGEWNVRKCSAAALDSLACVYRFEVLSVLLPRLQDRLLNTERWEVRESGVLALGAVAVGCYEGIVPHMPKLFPYLLNSLGDSHHRVRVMSCWTLSRYTQWILEGKDDAKLLVVLKALSDRILDRNKTVQRSACSAFAALEEQAGRALAAHVGPILRTVATAFERYQQNNVVALYDTLCSLADAVGDELAKEMHVNVLMPPLVNRWNMLPDDDISLVPLFECLACVFRALGLASGAFVLPIFSRCVNIVEATYARESGGVCDESHAGMLAGCIDLMCSLTEALGPRLDALLVQPAHGRATLLQLLYVAMKDPRQEVRQSAFALVGEFARCAMPSIIPVLVEYVNVIVGALNPEYMRCANNATWALGEIVMMAGFLPASIPVDRGALQKPLLEQALPSLIRVVNIPHLNKCLVENSAITLGRLGLVMPDAVAPRLEAFAEATLSALRTIRDDGDKEHAFSGINATIKVNPNGVLKWFALYADAVASWLYVPPKLEAEFGTILLGYKTSLGEHWPALYSTCPADLQRCLEARFGI
jgi:transportin-1